MRTGNNDVLSLIRNIHSIDDAVAIFQEKDKIEIRDEFIKLPHKLSILKLFYMSLPMMYIFPKLAWGFFYPGRTPNLRVGRAQISRST